MDATSPRAFRFALPPKPFQAKVIDGLSRDAKRVYNTLVWGQRFALKRIRRGGLYNLANEGAELLAQKNRTGMACSRFPILRKHGFYRRMTPEQQKAFEKRLIRHRHLRLIKRLL